LKILIADDHPVVRQGLRRILMEGFNTVVIGEAGNDPEVLDQVQRHKWDLVLMDITMPGRGGLDLLRQLKQDKPRLPVLVLSVHGEDQYGIRAIRAGASGYLTKETIPERLIAAIKKIFQGGKYISESLGERLSTELGTNFEKLPHENLSDRELQVMCMIASGKTTRTIAREISLSVKTISTYRSRILAKMNLTSTTEIILYVLQNKLTGEHPR